uniref:Uncharacterized protein n=1 Tax=Schizaphis graminum TaxID=13262 RepID=A0A2S2PF49_SCHGA
MSEHALSDLLYFHLGTSIHWWLRTRTLPSRDTRTCTIKRIQCQIKCMTNDNPENVHPTGHQFRRITQIQHTQQNQKIQTINSHGSVSMFITALKWVITLMAL